jgi:ankyrin repeat protein
MNSDVEESIDTSSVDHCSDAADEKYMELYKLCNGSDYNSPRILDWLEKNKGNQKLLENAANYKDACDMTPLHMLFCYSSPPPKLVERLLQLAPDTVKVKGIWGKLPLHMACDYWRLSSDSCDVISMLLQAYPEAARVQDEDGRLPLHCVCESASFPELIKMLVEAYPGGPRVRNISGRSPLHLACGACTGDKESLQILHLLLEACPESINMTDEENNRPSDCLKINWIGYYGTKNDLILHDTIIGKFSQCLVKLILDAFPEKCMEQDNRGMIPLHYASVSRAPHFFKYVVALLEAGSSADGLIVQDKKGRTPWQILKRRACKRDKNKMLPLHRIVASSDRLNAKSLKLFLDAYPAGVTTADKYGLLPFHYACLNPTSSVEVLWTFLNLCPEVIGFSEIIKKKRKISQKCSDLL